MPRPTSSRFHLAAQGSFGRLAVFLLAAAACLGAAPAPAAAPPPAPRAAGYRGIWFTLGQFSEYGDKYSGGLGTYTASHNPLAVYAPAVEKTFFVYGGSPAGERHLLHEHAVDLTLQLVNLDRAGVDLHP